MDGWIVGWLDEWLVGWLDGWMVKQPQSELVESQVVAITSRYRFTHSLSHPPIVCICICICAKYLCVGVCSCVSSLA